MDFDDGEGHRRSRRVASRAPNKVFQIRPSFDAGSALSASCNFCKQRHIRCDGKTPCGQCVKRNLGCQYGVRAKTGPKPRVSTDSAYQHLYSEIQIYKQRADYWKNKFLNLKSQMETEVVMLQSPNSSGSGSHSGSDMGSRHSAKLAARRAIKESRRSVWSSALATMTYLTNLAQAGGMVHACYLEDVYVPVAKIPIPEDHAEFSRAPKGSMMEADDAPSDSRVALALDLFETSIAPMVTDYKLKRSMSAAMSVWDLSIGDACKLDGSELMVVFEHSVALAMAFSAMQDMRCGVKYGEQMENLLRIVFFPRELHMLLQYADKMAHLLIHILMFFSGDEKVGRRQTIVSLAYQIISLHRPFISQSSMHRIFMTMMTYAANHRDRQSWMAEAMNCEASSEFNEVLYFKHAFHILYVFCSIHPRMSYEMPRPNYGFKELFGFLQILEYAALKLGSQDNEYGALANAFPDIALSFHLFIHGTRAECLFLLGDHRLALQLAQWVIECAEYLENPNWQLLFALQSALEICFVMKQLDWVYRAVHLLGVHANNLPLAVTFNERNKKILNIHLPPSVAEELQAANEARLLVEGNSDRTKRAAKHWRDITESTPPLEHVQPDLDVNAVILKEPTTVDETPTDPLCISNMLARSVLDGTIASTMAHQLGIQILKDETMIPPVARRSQTNNGPPSNAAPTVTGVNGGVGGGITKNTSQTVPSSSPGPASRARTSSTTSDIDEEDVQALLSIGNLLETVEDDTLNTELRADGVYSHGKSSRAGLTTTSSSSFSSPSHLSPASPARYSHSNPTSPLSTSPSHSSLLSAPFAFPTSTQTASSLRAEFGPHPTALHTNMASNSMNRASSDLARLLAQPISPPAFVTTPSHHPSTNNDPAGRGSDSNAHGKDTGLVKVEQTSRASHPSSPTSSPSKAPLPRTGNPTPSLYQDGTTDPNLAVKLGLHSILPTTLPPGFPHLAPLFPSQINPTQLTPSHLTGTTPSNTLLGSLSLPVINSYLLPAPYILRPPTAPNSLGTTASTGSSNSSPLNTNTGPNTSSPSPMGHILGPLPSSIPPFANAIISPFPTPAFVGNSTLSGSNPYTAFPSPYQPPHLHAGNMHADATTAPFTMRPTTNGAVPLPAEFQANRLTPTPQMPPTFGSPNIMGYSTGGVDREGGWSAISLLNTTSGAATPLDLSAIIAASSVPNHPRPTNQMNVD